MICNSTTALPLTAAYQAFLDQLTEAGLFIPQGVQGVYGFSGAFEDVLQAFDRFTMRRSAHIPSEPMHFPGVLSREVYLKTSHIENFPDLMGSVHSFVGREREHAGMLAKRQQGEEWTQDLSPSQLMLTPAGCYQLYPTATGTLTEQGRTVKLVSSVFRHEPSVDPCRMQVFRMREYVRIGTPDQALEHRRQWLALGKDILTELGLGVEVVLANDPFFGRGGRVMAASQKEQDLKHEFTIAVATSEKPTAIGSTNCHMDYFGKTFDIKTPDGATAHSACIGFGLERVTLALFKHHGLDPDHWPQEVKNALAL
ncbi:MAG: amino acid--[acyl-carrier-protein] ligase [Verrucomicrobiaceae bacterium]|nr:amino acid--[acyl-carrier-protein] ligase [Verrucomicrobiaceae bacterium]